MKSKVYFTDFRTKLGEGLPTKLKRLIKDASQYSFSSPKRARVFIKISERRFSLI